MTTDTIKHWRIGDVEIARIVEVNAWEDDITMLLPEATPEYVQQFKWLQPHFATPEGKMIISFQCFVLRSKGRSVMIDTCVGTERDREFPVFTNMQTTFLEDLATAGFPHESITDVLCTHLHFDHVGWNTRKVNGKWVPTFPKARYFFGRKEFAHWKHLRDTNGYHHMEHLKDAIDPVVEAGLGGIHRPRLQAHRRGVADPDTRPHARPCQRAHPIAGRKRRDHRRPDAQPHPDRRARHRGALRHGQGRWRAHPRRVRAALQ